MFDQNHKDNHKNSMAGTTIVLDCKRGDEVVVYAYTGRCTREEQEEEEKAGGGEGGGGGGRGGGRGREGEEEEEEDGLFT